jgi:glycosyltransferase involved in cell wall biosynthesis
VIAGKQDKLTERLRLGIDEDQQNMIHFAGYVTEGQLRWLYENTLCYVFPSLSEGFGLPGLEAMQHGAPVACSKATCLPEIYGDAALYFSPYSVIEMSEVINDIITSKKLRQELITKGKRQASKYSWRRMAEQTLAIYEGIFTQSK